MNINIDNQQIEINSIRNLKIIMEFFPGHKEQLIRYILNDLEEFRCFTKDIDELKKLTQYFPDYKNQFIQCVLNDLEEFRRLTKNIYGLEKLAEYFPKYESQLIQYVLNNPKELRWVCKNTEELEYFAQKFPEYTILQKNSVEEVIAALRAKDKFAIAEKSRVLYQGKFDASGHGKFGIFERIPEKFLKDAVTMTANPRHHDAKEANEIAEGNFRWPSTSNK